jgi:hypothetical protein
MRVGNMQVDNHNVVGYKSASSLLGGQLAMSRYKQIALPYARVAEMLAYDPLTGSLTWLKSPSKNTEAGSEAGCVKGSRVHKKTGLVTRYRYVKLDGYESPAARFAWCLHHKEWPDGDIRFVDSDPSNFRISNLSLAMFKTVRVDKGGLVQHKMSKEASRHYGYKRYYGMDFADYVALAAAQKNVCAICEQPETHVMHGKVKPLSVDHNHSTGSVRGLLCASCNHMLGHAKENRATFLSAIRYLDKHSDAGIVPFVPKAETK